MNNTEMRQELIHLGGGAHALAIQILGNPDDAADAVHDAFTKVLSRPAAYDFNRGPFKPWFLRVVRNHCVDLLRRRHNAEPADALVNPGKAPDQALELLQRDEGLRKALASIPPDQRQILVLRDYLDLSYADIAGVLDIAPGTVMSRLHRARMALRGVLERNDE